MKRFIVLFTVVLAMIFLISCGPQKANKPAENAPSQEEIAEFEKDLSVLIPESEHMEQSSKG